MEFGGQYLIKQRFSSFVVVVPDMRGDFWIYYEKRKEYWLSKMGKDISMLEAKIRFIDSFVKGELELRNRKEVDIVKDLKKMGLPEFGGYDYLLNMQVRSLTKERIEKLKKQLKDVKDKSKKLEGTTEKELYMKDLEEF